MRRVADDARRSRRSISGGVPAFLAEPGSEAVALALALTGANSTSAVSYATEAGLFEEAGCSTVICGPGDIAQAHAADEFVTVAQLDACMAFLARARRAAQHLSPLTPELVMPGLVPGIHVIFSSTAQWQDVDRPGQAGRMTKSWSSSNPSSDLLKDAGSKR